MSLQTLQKFILVNRVFCSNIFWGYFLIFLIKEVRYNCSAHHSGHPLINAISGHNHNEQSQSQRLNIKYSG